MLAFAFEVVIGLIAGIVAGVRKGKFFDSLVLVSTLVVISIPIFVLGFVAQLLFGVQLGWFPVAGIRQGLYSYFLPAMVLGSVSLAYVAQPHAHQPRREPASRLRADRPSQGPVVSAASSESTLCATR